MYTYKLDAESRELRYVEIRGPWAVVFRAIARMLLQALGFLNRVVPDDETSNLFRVSAHGMVTCNKIEQTLGKQCSPFF